MCGYLAYWDELRRRHPNMLIDSCASGGRRNDLETMRRAVPLWRSDYAYEPIGHQCMTYGISLWLPYPWHRHSGQLRAPYYGGGLTAIEPYAFWSNAAPSLGGRIDVPCAPDQLRHAAAAVSPVAAARRVLLRRFLSADALHAGQPRVDRVAVQRPGGAAGAVQAFRRAECGAEESHLRLHDLVPAATYEITLLEQPSTARATGRELMTEGLRVVPREKPSAAVVLYRQAK